MSHSLIETQTCIEYKVCNRERERERKREGKGKKERGRERGNDITHE